MKLRTALSVALFGGLLCLAPFACTTAPPEGAEGDGDKLSGTIKVDGSSTVEPITKAVIEQFKKKHPDVTIPMSVSGSSGGFKKFWRKETAINNSSRSIRESEIEQAKKDGIAWTELRLAKDGISVVVNKENDWVETMTVAQLKQLWEADSKVTTWADIDPSWPSEEIKLFGPDTESGTFEFFTEAVNGEKGNIRTDYTASSDDNPLVEGVAGSKNGLGYFGYAYYAANKDRLKIVPIKADESAKAITPSPETIRDGTYTPLSRPLFIYVRNAELARPEVQAFLNYYVDEGQEYVEKVGYVGVSDADLKAAREALDKAIEEATADKGDDAE